MSPSMSKTTQRPSGLTSRFIQVPSVVSNSTSVDGPCSPSTSHFFAGSSWASREVAGRPASIRWQRNERRHVGFMLRSFPGGAFLAVSPDRLGHGVVVDVLRVGHKKPSGQSGPDCDVFEGGLFYQAVGVEATRIGPAAEMSSDGRPFGCVSAWVLALRGLGGARRPSPSVAWRRWASRSSDASSCRA